MISLGGKAQGANIEVHDVQFAVGETIEEVLPLVIDKWYGLNYKLHMDSYMALTIADGYKIELSTEPSETSDKLFFLHLGGYLEQSTQEIHDVRFVVAQDEKDAKRRGNSDQSFDYIESHVDSVVDVEEVLLPVKGEKYYINLSQSDQVTDLVPDWFGYRRLDS